VVIDTNVRRVLARVGAGVADQQASATSRRLVESYLPEEPAVAARWAVASMELGALACTARAPRCDECPIADLCAWRSAGSPALAEPVRRTQSWHGTDRQCRGALLAAVRGESAPIARRTLLSVWPEQEQAERCLSGLVCENLLHGTQVISLYE
jgi:A/G-specific adenine glycosylase